VERRRLAMSKVVLDVSMSLDGFTAGPNVRAEEPMGTAANGCTSGWRERGLMAGSTSVSAGRRTRRAELIPEGKPVTGAVTHLRYRVPKP
jgi:hypothetical protein